MNRCTQIISMIHRKPLTKSTVTTWFMMSYAKYK
nr:MAG TPA: hypothetical protein [Caudoviricetes sp.]